MGALFKVVKETILTDSFNLSETKKESTRSLHMTNKKVAVGEIVEVREWPKKRAKFGSYSYEVSHQGRRTHWLGDNCRELWQRILANGVSQMFGAFVVQPGLGPGNLSLRSNV